LAVSKAAKPSLPSQKGDQSWALWVWQPLTGGRAELGKIKDGDKQRFKTLPSWGLGQAIWGCGCLSVWLLDFAWSNHDPTSRFRLLLLDLCVRSLLSQEPRAWYFSCSAGALTPSEEGYARARGSLSLGFAQTTATACLPCSCVMKLLCTCQSSRLKRALDSSCLGLSALVALHNGSRRPTRPWWCA